MNNKKVKDDFGIDSQKNARTNGKYWKIAKKVEASKCVFCDLREKYIIKKDKHNTLTVNLFPYIDGQLLVIPSRHIESFYDLNEKELLSLHSFAKLGMNLLRKLMGHKDFWWIIRDGEFAGKTIKHFHGNIMPYTDDLNTWHYQEIKTAPLELAKKLRREL